MKLSYLVLSSILVSTASYCFAQPSALLKNIFYIQADETEATQEEQNEAPKSIIKGKDWAHPQNVMKRIEQKVMSELKGIDRENIISFIKNPQNRLLLAQWEFAKAESLSDPQAADKRLSELREQAKTQKDDYQEMAQVPLDEMSSKMKYKLKKMKEDTKEKIFNATSFYSFKQGLDNEQVVKLLDTLGSNLNWLEQMVYTGECTRPGMAVSILSQIMKKYPRMMNNRMERDIATATALEFAKYNWSQYDAVQRADYYIVNHKRGFLNSMFNDITFWQRRMVCGCKGDNSFGDRESLQWCLENVNVPADTYHSTCWRAAYRLFNIYGDSIHGPYYYAPFQEQYEGRYSEMVTRVGGVCGSLSHLGAFSALAHGVPAMTAGEPGHCAFIVLVRDHKGNDVWQPAYSLSWKRGLHWQIWEGVHRYSSLHAATEMYHPKSKSRTMLSNAYMTLGKVYAKYDIDKSLDCFASAVIIQPNNFQAWRAYCETIKNYCSNNTDAWLRINKVLTQKLVPVYPEIAAEISKRFIYPNIKQLDEKTKEKICKDFWNNAEGFGPDRWEIEDLAGKQLDLCLDGKKNNKSICEFYAKILSATATNTKYLPVILTWGNSLAEKMNENDKKMMMAANIKGLSDGKEMAANDRDKSLEPVILAAEAMRDINSFQALSKMVSEQYRNFKEANIPSFNPFPGKLASQGGLIWTSSTSQWDKPCAHPGVLTPNGGSFHTGKDTDAFVGVVLPKQVFVTGIVLVATNGNFHRLNNMKIQVSESGNDNDWQDVYKHGQCKERVIRIDLQNKLPRAKYIRIIREGGPEFFHLNGIYVYGNQAA